MRGEGFFGLLSPDGFPGEFDGLDLRETRAFLGRDLLTASETLFLAKGTDLRPEDGELVPLTSFFNSELLGDFFADEGRTGVLLVGDVDEGVLGEFCIAAEDIRPRDWDGDGLGDLGEEMFRALIEAFESCIRILLDALGVLALDPWLSRAEVLSF